MSGVSQINLYDVLGVPSSAPTREIRQAFHRQALRLHPDKREVAEGDGHQAFLQVMEAAERLLDCEQRAIYDASLGLRTAREIGCVSETVDLLDPDEEFYERKEEEGAVAAAQTEGGDSAQAVRVFVRECRCGGEYEVITSQHPRYGAPTASENHSTATTTTATMMWDGQCRVRHVVECDCCSLVIEIAGLPVLQSPAAAALALCGV